MRVIICRAICKWSACGLGKSAIDQMADLRPKWPFCRWRNLLAKHAIFFQMAIWCKWPFAPPNGPFGPVAKRTLSFRVLGVQQCGSSWYRRPVSWIHRTRDCCKRIKEAIWGEFPTENVEKVSRTAQNMKLDRYSNSHVRRAFETPLKKMSDWNRILFSVLWLSEGAVSNGGPLYILQ